MIKPSAREFFLETKRNIFSFPKHYCFKQKFFWREKKFGLRWYFKEKFGKEVADRLFGYVRGAERVGGRIFVSHLYKEDNDGDFYYLKIWAFLPSCMDSKLKNIMDLRNIANEIEKHICNDVFKGGCIVPVEKTFGEEILSKIKTYSKE